MKKLKLHPLFVVMIAAFVLLGWFLAVLSSVLALFLHEFGHAIAAKRFGYEIKQLYLLPFGAGLSLTGSALAPKHEIVIAVMGPVFSLAGAIVCTCVWWVFPASFSVSYLFVYSCLALFIINILPAFPLDGGRIVWALLCYHNGEKAAHKTLIWLNLFFASMFFVLFATSLFGVINISFGFMCLFLVNGLVDNRFSSHYAKLMFCIEKRKYSSQMMQVKTIAVLPHTSLLNIVTGMSKTKLNQIIVCLPNGKLKMLSELQFEMLCQNFSLCTTIGEIFCQNIKNG